MSIFNNPYPLLNNQIGNFSNYKFSVELSENFRIENGIYNFNFQMEVDEPIINSLIENGDASFCIQTDSKPFYRKLFKSTLNKKEVVIEINYEEIPSEFTFEFTPLIITEKSIKYHNDNADSPMNLYNFSLQKNQIIGSHPSIKISFDRGYQNYENANLIQFIKLPNSKKPINGTMDIKLDDHNFIKIYLSEEKFLLFKEINKQDPKILDAVLTFPILQYTLTEVLINREDYQDKGWANILNDEFDIFELNDTESIFKKIDEILQSPQINYFNYYLKKYIGSTIDQ